MSSEIKLRFGGTSAKRFRDLPRPQQELPQEFLGSANYAEMLLRASAMQAGTSADAMLIDLLPRASVRGVLIESASATCARLNFRCFSTSISILYFICCSFLYCLCVAALFGIIINWLFEKFV